MCSPIVLAERTLLGTKYKVLCPTHGSIGSKYIADDAESLAIDHEVHYLKIALTTTV